MKITFKQVYTYIKYPLIVLGAYLAFEFGEAFDTFTLRLLFAFFIGYFLWLEAIKEKTFKVVQGSYKAQKDAHWEATEEEKIRGLLGWYKEGFWIYVVTVFTCVILPIIFYFNPWYEK